MTGAQWANLVENYGFPAAFALVSIAGMIGLVFLAVKTYPMLSATVDFINLIKGDGKKAGLDDRLDGIEEAGRTAAAVDARKEETLAGIKKDVAKTESRLDEHLRLDGVRQAEWETIRDGWVDLQAKVGKIATLMEGVDVKTNVVIHEVKHNGGSSLKDSTVRQEDRLDAILRILEEREK